MKPLAETAPMAPFDAWRHRYALACAVATALLLVAGGLVTSTGSGLAVPDWPLSFGKVFPPMAGGVLFEHGHRLVAASVGVLTLILAFWFARRESRAWVRRLAYVAVGAILAQGLLGGLTVLLRLPPAVSVLHACLAQGFFCIVVVLALATSKGFVARRPAELPGEGAPPLWVLGAAATGLVYAQLILGAVMRHTGAGLAIPDVPLAFGRLVPPMLSFEIAIHFAHRAGALVVAAAVVFLAGRILRRHGGRPELAGPARLLIILVAVQILLGGATVVTRLAVLPATAHVVAGALLLAASLVVTVRAARARLERPAAVPLKSPASRGASPADFVELTKPRVTSLVLVTTFVGFYLGSKGALDLGLLLNTLLGTALVAAGTSALNQYVEREQDGLMLRTRRRPLPAGRMEPAHALLFAAAISAAGLLHLALTVNLLTAGLAALTLSSYVCVYTPLKRVSSLCTLVGAIPGALPPLGGWTAAQGEIAAGGLALFAILFVWQLPHSLSIAILYRDDYARGGFRLLPVVDPDGGSTGRQILAHCLVLLPLSLVPSLLAVAGEIYFFGALVLGVVLTACAVPIVLNPTARAARRLLLASVIYLPILLCLMAFDRTAPPPG